MVYYISKSKNFQFENFGKYPILSPDLAMENDIVQQNVFVERKLSIHLTNIYR
jgi:hypothetical protein